MQNTLSQSVRNIYKQTKNISQLMNIIEFAESSSGLGVTLYPVQRFIFKVFYGLALSDDISENPIKLTDEFNEVVIKQFDSEIEFFKFLYEEKRINVSYEEWSSGETDFVEILFVIGRRGSKTTMTSIITCYTLYVVLSLEDPHTYFNIMSSDSIGVALVSNNEDNAHRQFMAVSDLLSRSRFFNRFITKRLAGSIWLASEKYKEVIEDGDAGKAGNILVTSFPASPKVRGSSNAVAVIDEFDHFMDADNYQKEMRLAERVYEALVPSVSGFIDQQTRKAFGRSFIISSPNGVKGVMYKLYKHSLEFKSSLMLQLPSNWVNPNIASQILRSEYNKSPSSFKQEYRAEFTEKEGDWVDNNTLTASFDIGNLNTATQQSNVDRYYTGFDLGVKNDRAVFAIGRLSNHLPEKYIPLEPELAKNRLADKGPYYIIEYVRIWKPEEFPTGIIDVETLLKELDFLHTRFKIIDGSYDQFSGGIFTQLLEKFPRINMSYEPATVYNNSERAMLMSKLFREGRIILPYIEDIDDEFRLLKETILKNSLVKVHNDSGHDDIYSAISRCVEKIFRQGVIEKEYKKNFISSGISSKPLVRLGNGRMSKGTGNTSRDRLLMGRTSQRF